ncbi:MAG: hypothetical protein Ta2G_06290 [Termitinemataceae bacterium]|nr:MAG: hypothetical protein Ta2G_06290 [Termitinemataceae bacterium]
MLGLNLLFRVTFNVALVSLCFACIFLSCKDQTESEENLIPEYETRTVNAPSGGANYDIYLLKINTSYAEAARSTTGTALMLEKQADTETSYEAIIGNDGFQQTCSEPAFVREFNANPPVKTAQKQAVKPALQDGMLQNGAVSFSTYAPADGKFWVQNANGTDIQINAYTKKTGEYCTIWIEDDAFTESSSENTTDGKINQSQVDELAQKFDALYLKETALLGYEYGGGGQTPVGGVDGDPRVQILISDIFFDTNNGNTIGYFYSADEYTEEELRGSAKTNKCEMFYIDSYFLDKYPNTTYSTLVHEFQHMIHFNQKTVKHKLNSSSWFNEMLSLMTEDVIAPLIGISQTSSGHPILERMPLYLTQYPTLSLTSWRNGSDSYLSYSSAFAFSAYLARNFGGAALINLMESNNKIDAASISAALTACSGNTHKRTVKTFEDAFKRWGEALIYTETSASNGGNFSFNNTVTSTISGTNYTYHAFDISEIRQQIGQTVYSTKGLKVSSVNKKAMPAFSIDIQTSDLWKNLKGATTIKLEKPLNPNIELVLYAVPVN